MLPRLFFENVCFTSFAMTVAGEHPHLPARPPRQGYLTATRGETRFLLGSCVSYFPVEGRSVAACMIFIVGVANARFNYQPGLIGPCV